METRRLSPSPERIGELLRGLYDLRPGETLPQTPLQAEGITEVGDNERGFQKIRLIGLSLVGIGALGIMDVCNTVVQNHSIRNFLTELLPR